MTKPVDAGALLAKVGELIARGRERRAREREVVLAIGAHPDDVEIGCGGILLRHAAAGAELVVLTLTGGEAGGTIETRAAESRLAAELLSARLYHRELSDMSVSDGGLTINAINEGVDEVQPARVYTHTLRAVPQDHRSVHHATPLPARR